MSYKCKVCYDAGKPAAVYNSHYVKSANRSTVTCPIILAIKCRYCGEMGHTLKYCAKLSAKENLVKEKEKVNTSAVVAKAPIKNVNPKLAIQNMFSMLDEDEDEEDEDEDEQDQEQQVQDAGKSYADAVNREAAPVLIPPMPKLVRAEVKRWADYSDSEDEEE